MKNLKQIILILSFFFFMTYMLYPQNGIKKVLNVETNNFHQKPFNTDDTILNKTNILLERPFAKKINTNNELMDSIIITYHYGGKCEVKFTYDSNGYNVYEVIKYWDGTSLSGGYQIYYTYDSVGNNTIMLTEYLNGTSLCRSTYTYDADGNEISELGEFWNRTSWLNSNRSTYIYDSNGYKTSFLYEMWAGVNWVGERRCTYSRDAEGNMISAVQEKRNGTNWVNVSQYTYWYDSSGNETSFLFEKWNDTSWVNYSQYTYEYDSNGNVISFLTEKWDSTSWVNYDKYTYTYNSNGNQISSLNEQWDGTNWVNVVRITYTYDANNRMVSGFSEQWDGANWILGEGVFYFDNEFISNSSGEKFEIFYASLTDIRNNEISKNNFVLSQNYPNPFNPTTKIQYTIPTVGVQRAVSVQLKIYNVLGKEVATLVNEYKSAGEYKVEFDASVLPSGVYFYQLKAGSFVETKKMVLLR